MKRLILAACGLLVCVATVSAQSDPITERRGLMKAQGAATGVAAKMIKGDDPFDLAKAKGTFETYLKTTARFGDLFPDSSKTGDTRATAKIWDDNAGFKAAIAKFDADSKAGIASTTDLDTFKVAFGKATANCNACHDAYRGPARN